MVISEKRLQSNRLNSLKARERATGPHDSSTTRFNAVKHGMCATLPFVMPYEDKEYFEKLSLDIKKRFRPKDVFDDLLCEQITSCIVSLRRGRFAEKAILESYMDLDDNVDWVGVLKGDPLGKIGRYERRIWGQLSSLLKKIQN